MSNYPSLTGISLKGKQVLLRAGFDLPMEDGKVTDISRVEAIIPTMQHVLREGASLVIMAHQDRPKGKVVPEFSQKPIVPILEKLLETKVAFAESCVGADTKKLVDDLAPGEVLLLENLRYEAGEEAGDEEFAKTLASYGDVYVNDAFSNSHRKHASMVAVAKLLPAYMGLQLEQEVTHLSSVTENPKHPLTLIVSGAKIETKLPVIEYFLDKGEEILTGGAIANTLVAASGKHVGKSLYESDTAKAKELLVASGKGKNATIRIPSDGVVSTPDAVDTSSENVSLDEVSPDNAIYDIGAASAADYAAIIAKSKCIVWNGPLGMYENERFAGGSKTIAAAIAAATKKGAISIIGGGDTIDFHTKYGLPLNAYTFVSTGGGAMLDFVSGKKLPAIEALKRS